MKLGKNLTIKLEVYKIKFSKSLTIILIINQDPMREVLSPPTNWIFKFLF